MLTDTISVRNSRFFFSLFAMLFVSITSARAYTILYAEQFYRLYHVHFYQYPERISENIFYLESALRADFCNPLYALADIDNKEEWERYRYLFTMHVNLKLVELYLRWGSKYDKRVAYFFNAPWKEDNLKSLEKAERLYKYARIYWEETKKWSEKAWGSTHHFERIQEWEDENYRIEKNELDYEDIINDHLARLQKVRDTFNAMDETTY